MKNLARITNYHNKLKAADDWISLCRAAVYLGIGETAAKLAPPEGSSWRKLDKASAQLFAAIKAVEQTRAIDTPLACPYCKTLQADGHDEYCPFAMAARH